MQPRVIFMAIVYHSKKNEEKNSKVKGMWVKSEGNPAQAFRVLSQWCYTGRTWFPEQRAVTMHVKCSLSRKLVRDSVLRLCFGGWSCSYPLPGIYQSSRVPEGNRVFSNNHTVYTNVSSTMSRFHQFREW